MPSQSFKSTIKITHIGTATALIDIDGVIFLTDPAFDPAGSVYPIPGHKSLVNEVGPALEIDQLPHIDAILLSHEDHDDNLDHKGRTLLEGRKVYTTQDGANKLKPRPDVYGFAPWQSRQVTVGHKRFTITATFCKHWIEGETVGFMIETDSFGTDDKSGLPNAIWFGGDTVNVPELLQIKEKWHVVVAILNLGNAIVEGLQITMSGQDAAVLCQDLGVEHICPIHFEGWQHFTEHGEELKKSLVGEGIAERVRWLKLGEAVQIV
jgi:L-ascorbate metabolism protein UlaG (beta-lactamase superfamily)